MDDSLDQTPFGRQVPWQDTLNTVLGGASSLVSAFKSNDTANNTVATARATPPPQNNNLVLWIVLGVAGVLGLILVLRR